IGHISEIARYPIKSMAGTTTDSAVLGGHGLEGDRRYAFRRMGDESGFSWLSASRFREILFYHPFGLGESPCEPLPTHVPPPDGRHLELRSPELLSEVNARSGLNLELIKLNHGIFDDAPVSVISLATIAGISREAGADLDRRRFRANIVIDTTNQE